MKDFREENGELTGAVIGAAVEVHRVLGAWFLESVYESALAVELRARARSPVGFPDLGNVELKRYLLNAKNRFP